MYAMLDNNTFPYIVQQQQSHLQLQPGSQGTWVLWNNTECVAGKNWDDQWCGYKPTTQGF